jgi:TonB family protein
VRGRLAALCAAAGVHAIAAAAALGVSARTLPGVDAARLAAREPAIVEVTRLVFLAPVQPPDAPRGGGGGGGNQQAAPIRRASGIGHDAVTLRTRKPEALSRASQELTEMPHAVVLDARPLASGTFDQIGLPDGGVPLGTSLGPGSGGGVGEGIGTGIGSGRGPGLGPGEGGGAGGGAYRPGGSVTAPRLLSQVQPAYTPDALERHVQGRVVLEIVVRRDGCAADIRVMRTLDPGLDREAVRAVSQWQFEPGRLHGTPVDVIATVTVDFTIR